MGFAADRRPPGEEPLPYRTSPPICPQGEGVHAASMVEQILRDGANSSSEVLRELRAAFPDSPLTVRVAALDLLRRRSRPAS